MSDLINIKKKNTDDILNLRKETGKKFNQDTFTFDLKN